LPSREIAAKAVLFVLALIPVANFIDGYVAGEFARPWRTLIQDSGEWSMRFLVLGLCMSPLVALTGLTGLHAFRRMIGLFGAFYAALHLFAWIRQYGYDWPFLTDEVLLRLYLSIGFIAVVLLVPLAATSPGFMHRLLGAARWRRLHALMYPTVLAAFLHYEMVRGFSRVEVAIDAVLLALSFAWRLWPRRAAA
jgi:sulfoxide reductase heme-binding subunit YedZ